jgi:hypothetical protein
VDAVTITRPAVRSGPVTPYVLMIGTVAPGSDNDIRWRGLLRLGGPRRTCSPRARLRIAHTTDGGTEKDAERDGDAGTLRELEAKRPAQQREAPGQTDWLFDLHSTTA